MLSRIVSLVPERLARVPTGTTFALQSATTRHAERLEHLAAQLNWLTPLASQDRESQQRLGLLNAAGRPVMAAEDEPGSEEGSQDMPEEAEDAVA
jgi:hypothetical protein